MKKYDNFCNALTNLKDIYECREPYNNIEMTGLVGLFEICFEQAWKAMKEILENNGLAHAYNKDIALDIIHNTKEVYYQLFCELKAELEKNWL